MHADRQRGFSLLEAIVALAILASVGMALFAAMNQSLSMVARAEKVRERESALRNAVAWIQVINPAQQPRGEHELGALRQARTWLDYALRRVLRIWPLYLVVLVASWLALSAGHPLLYDIDTAALWRHLTLREGRSVLWSIPVEFTFYLWLPLLVLVLAGMARWRWPAWAQTGVFLVALAAVTWRWPPAESVENGVQLGPYLAVFLCGAFAARVDEWAARRPSPTWWGAAALLAMALWCIAIPAIWCRLRGMPFEATVTRTWYLFFGMIWAMLLLATLHGPAWLQRAFAWPGLRWVGLVSFSLYLWHMPVMEALLRAGVIEHLSWAAVLVVLAVALAVAWLSWRLFERPLQGIRLRRQR